MVGIHAAADSHYHWPWHRQMLGAAFASHPPGTREGRIVLLEPGDVTVRALPASFLRHDEWCYFRDVGSELTIVAAFDPASIGEDGGDLLPLSWRQTFEGARIFCSGMGHTNESFSEPLVRGHIAAGLARSSPGKSDPALTMPALRFDSRRERLSG